jgi:co-chaperonin GroES (HSP10)
MVKPYGNNIVAVQEVANTTKSGILLTSVTAEQVAPRKATVRAVGPDVKHFKPGDEIVYKPYATFEIALGDGDDKDEFFVIDADDVLCAVVEDEE